MENERHFFLGSRKRETLLIKEERKYVLKKERERAFVCECKRERGVTKKEISGGLTAT